MTDLVVDIGLSFQPMAGMADDTQVGAGQEFVALARTGLPAASSNDSTTDPNKQA